MAEFIATDDSSLREILAQEIERLSPGDIDAEDCRAGRLENFGCDPKAALSAMRRVSQTGRDAEMLTCVPVPEADLLDGERYLVQCKHGLIEGTWEAENGYFCGYYWQDITFWGTAFTIPTLTLPVTAHEEGEK